MSRRILGHTMQPVARARRRLAPIVALMLAALLVGTGGPATPAPVVAAAREAYRVNLANGKDYVQQTNFVQCVGTSIQMMLNIMRPGADRSAKTQRRLQNLARAWSGPTPTGFQRQGASVRGWAASLVIHRAGAYKVVGADSLQEAMKIAATAIREYKRPVGLLVWRGRHAWVMSGFEATGDPLLPKKWRVTKAYILDPLYPHGDDVWGPSPTPGRAISVAAVGRQFVRRQSNRSSAWNQLPGQVRLRNKWVLVVPTGPIRQGIE
jgi:hypothetical protein